MTFVFASPPPTDPGRDGEPRWGVDVQRIVFFPYLSDVDHRPHVEHSLVSVRVGGYTTPSEYWTAAGEPAPDPDRHQAVLYDSASDVLPLPCSLSGLVPVSPAGVRAELFVSHPVPAGPGRDHTVRLVTEATTDHTPLLDGVHLQFSAVFANHRRADKPVQRLREVTDSTSETTSDQRQRSSGRQTVRVEPGFGNRQVMRTGSITDYVENPHRNLGDRVTPS